MEMVRDSIFQGKSKCPHFRRDGIKQFSQWPTIPRLYFKGEFVGGCDIVRELYETGELTEIFNTQGIERQPTNPE